MSTAHHAQTDGQTERLNRTLEDMLRNFLNFRMNNWTTLLPTLEFAYNSAKQESTGHSPFYLNYGYEPRTVLDVSNPDIEILKPTAAGKYLETLQAVSHEVRNQFLSAQLNQARYANRSRRDESFRVGDLVYLDSEFVRTPLERQRPNKAKLRPRRIGPYTVEEVLSRSAYRLRLPESMKRHPVFNVSRLSRYQLDDNEDFPNRVDNVPDPWNIPPQPTVETCEIDEILDTRGENPDKIEYLVHWKGYRPYMSSWPGETH